MDGSHPSAIRPVRSSPFGLYVPSQMGMGRDGFGSTSAPRVR